MDYLKRLELIRGADIEDLLDVEFLEYELIPALGMNDHMAGLLPDPPPPRFNVGGLRLQQYPNQLARFWRWIGSRNIQRYLEIGVANGGTFMATVEYLRRVNHGRFERGIACDPIPPGDDLRHYCDNGADCIYYQMSSHGPEFEDAIRGQTFDLVLIDGDHSEAAATADYHLVRGRSRYIAFHDLFNSGCPGVAKTFAKAAHDYPRGAVFCQQYDKPNSAGGQHAGFGVVYG